MALDINSITEAAATIDEAESLLLYTHRWLDEAHLDSWLYYDSHRDEFCYELISKFCNYHGRKQMGLLGIFQSVVPEFVYRFREDHETYVEGASWENGIFAHIRTPDERNHWQFAVRRQTAEIYNYPMPS